MAKPVPIRERALQSGIPILKVLSPGPLRTGDLQRAMEERVFEELAQNGLAVGGASESSWLVGAVASGLCAPQVLTQTLRGLERHGLIQRQIFSVEPPRVEYCLTPMGISLLKPLRELCHWAKAHINEHDAARKQVDEMTDQAPEPLRRPASAQVR